MRDVAERVAGRRGGDRGVDGLQLVVRRLLGLVAHERVDGEAAP
ncbi:hypothetical protein HMPREF0682_2462 [Propionibacterium acidifaciens F0233]|uniref:Uncharacterized protein n=1 Tax=Propionibacterium acidifaciens F0233 TaxID=553198 RepID=U2PVS9_9ACTN|nr:hypothetical protein HMPREF0682_2462 [Propionibacterium acidifaciens F0233]